LETSPFHVDVYTGLAPVCYDADFYPYGGERAVTDSCSQDFKFTGKERDGETGNDYFGARFYTSSFGRFISPDPLPWLQWQDGNRNEQERFAKFISEQDGQTLGEWCREMLLEQAEGRKPSVIEETVLAETLALRTILLNAFYKLAQGEKLTGDEMQAIIERADAAKAAKASARSSRMHS
jgi:RHS repeat-associated protein